MAEHHSPVASTHQFNYAWLMQLISFHITEFQSVLDSTPIQVGNVTCLVGKNESGKTALLQALYRLNPIREADKHYSVTDDYPRMEVTDYEEAIRLKQRTSATVVKAAFALSDAEVSSVREELGEKCFNTPNVVINKNYENAITAVVNINEQAAKEFVCRSLSSQLQSQIGTNARPKDILAVIQPSSGDPAVAAIIPMLQAAGEHDFAFYAWENILKDSLPKFLYFDEYYQMQGCENIQSLKLRKESETLRPSDQPLLGLIELARLDLDRLINHQRTQELKNRLEGAGNHLTRNILKYWSQNKHLRMRFDVRPALPGDPEGMREGTNIWGEVYDTRHFVSTALGSRSRGFVWFFSFVAWYSQIQGRRENVILLLDEPGLSLHGRGQGDLLRYFDSELAPHHQVIYTTHSPFIVDPVCFERVRIVQDKSIDVDGLPREEQGTKVLTDIFEASDDSLFPLQGALGYDIHQTLFIGPNCLLVEGASDMLYIQAISAFLDREGRESLSREWVLTPTGGASKVATFVRLLIGQHGMTIATLIDMQDQDKKMIENIYREKLLRQSNVLTFADFTGTKEADIEDMFAHGFYLKLVNSEYKDVLQKAIAVNDLTSQSPRILARLDEYFGRAPLTRGRFSHYRPARYFHENMAMLANQISSATMQRFEDAFNALNKLL